MRRSHYWNLQSYQVEVQNPPVAPVHSPAPGLASPVQQQEQAREEEFLSCECTSPNDRHVIEVRRQGRVVGVYTYCMNCGPEIVSGHEFLRALAEKETGDIWVHAWREAL